MKFSFNWLKEFVDFKESPEKLAEVLTLRTVEVGEIHKVGNDHILEVNILPNRGDLLSHLGLAREIAAIFKSKINSDSATNRKRFGGTFDEQNQKSKISEAKIKTKNDSLEIKVEEPDLCPRYSAGVLEGTTIKESPKWLRERLELLGLKSINNIVDATNYVMLELGQPLHVFDYDKIKGQKIVIRKARKGEKIKTLDENQTEYELNENILVIADESKPLAIAGIKGGLDSAVSPSTKNIVIESASFDKDIVSQTSARLNLRTDASLRFRYGFDRNLTTVALNRVAELIKEISGFLSDKGIIDVYLKKQPSRSIAVEKEYITKLIGYEIADQNILNILKNLYFDVEFKKNVFIIDPGFRLDIENKADVVEEIARIYGYENIPAKSNDLGFFPIEPAFWSQAEHVKEYRESDIWDTTSLIKIKESARDILKGLSFTELYNYSFLSDETKEIFSIYQAAEVLNPTSHQFRYLRTSLMPNLVLVAKDNARFFNNFKLFEMGKVFRLSDGKISELRRIAGINYGGNKNIFFETKGLIDGFLNGFGVADHWYDDAKPFSWESEEIRYYHPGVFAEIKIDDDAVGIVGEISPSIHSGLKIKNKLVGFEFDFIKLAQKVSEELEFTPLPKYPAVVRDIAILIDTNVRVSQILNTVEGADTKRIVRDVDVFDIYEDAPDLPEGMKSIAFHVIYQSDDHTLTDKEVDEVENIIKKALEENLGAEVR